MNVLSDILDGFSGIWMVVSPYSDKIKEGVRHLQNKNDIYAIDKAGRCFLDSGIRSTSHPKFFVAIAFSGLADYYRANGYDAEAKKCCKIVRDLNVGPFTAYADLIRELQEGAVEMLEDL